MRAIGPDTLRYFFSALAQSAAAFAGLAGIFAVFRLQTIGTSLRSQYSEARNWIVQVYAPSAGADSDEQIEDRLSSFSLEDDRHNRADELRIEVGRLKAMREYVPLALAAPLKWWAVIFFLSLVALGLSSYLISASLVVLVGFLAATARALWITGHFVQDCLSDVVPS